MTHPPLIAISSFRPLADSPAIATNQIRAVQSWALAFDGILLYGSHEPRLDSPRTAFIESDQYPKLAPLFYTASQFEQPACILNCDIVVAEHLSAIAGIAWAYGALAWTSRRYEFDPANPDYDGAKVKDLGADIFCAWPQVWDMAYRAVPSAYRLGAPTYDSWLLGFLTLTLKRKFVDLTKHRPIFHPKHGERIRPDMGPIARDKYIDSGVGFPTAI